MASEPTENNFVLPAYYKDFVLSRVEDGQISVTDVESYHAGLDSPVFVFPTYQGCTDFIDGTAKSKRFPLVYLREIYLRLATKIKAKRISTHQIFDIEFAGWLSAFAESKVGTHPVFNFTKHPPEGFRFVSSGRKRLNYFLLFKLFGLVQTVVIYSFRFWLRGVPLRFIFKFWATRGLALESLKLPRSKISLTLYPSFLFLCPSHPWFVEIEDMLTLTAPFIANGSRNPLFNSNHPMVKTMGVLFESGDCKGVVCHLRSTAEGLKKIYADNPKIVAKMFHIPLGMPVPRRLERKVTGQQRPLNILYINGWSQDRKATFRRGLLDTLKIFSVISKEFDHVTLTIRSQLPELSDEYLEILSDKKVILLEDKIHQSKLQELYRESDILLFPAVRIAVTTLMQAMANSMAIVASDGFGIEEYIEDGVNGLIGRGFNGQSGWIDKDGFFRENYILSLKSNPEVVANCVNHLRHLITDEEARVKLQHGARRALELKFSMDNWNRQFKPLLEQMTLA